MGAGVPRTGAIAAAVLADIDGTGGYAVVYSKHRGRAIRMGGGRAFVLRRRPIRRARHRLHLSDLRISAPLFSLLSSKCAA
jgi:hypothetical protein